MYLTLTERIALSLYSGTLSPLSTANEEAEEAEKPNPSRPKISPYQRQAQIACSFERSMRGDYN